jgi:hypothetical protein
MWYCHLPNVLLVIIIQATLSLLRFGPAVVELVSAQTRAQ